MRTTETFFCLVRLQVRLEVERGICNVVAPWVRTWLPGRLLRACAFVPLRRGEALEHHAARLARLGRKVRPPLVQTQELRFRRDVLALGAPEGHARPIGFASVCRQVVLVQGGVRWEQLVALGATLRVDVNENVFSKMRSSPEALGADDAVEAVFGCRFRGVVERLVEDEHQHGGRVELAADHSTK